MKFNVEFDMTKEELGLLTLKAVIEDYIENHKEEILKEADKIWKKFEALGTSNQKKSFTDLDITDEMSKESPSSRQGKRKMQGRGRRERKDWFNSN